MFAEASSRGVPTPRPPLAEVVLARHPVLALAGWWVWAMVEVSVVLFGVYRASFAPWVAVIAQVLAYGVLVAPIWLLRWPLGAPVGGSSRLIGLVVGGVVLAVAIAVTGSTHSPGFAARQVVRFTATGVGEEILWRGAIWTCLTRATPRLAVVVTVDVALFVSWHVPSVLAGNATWSGLPMVAALGAVFCAARVASRSVELPSLLHIAADLLGT